MARSRRERWLLAALVVLAIVGALVWLRPEPAATPRSASNPRGGGRAAAAPAATTAPDVHLDALNAEKPKPGDTDRDLFRFKPKPPPPPPPPPPGARGAAPPVEPVPSGPPPPPPLPPITLKFFGMIQDASGRKLAALSDGRMVLHGAEGEVVLGQYKILRIGAESIEMSYLDGRGRQTIRLSGS
jgi:hypothetical protein